MNDLSQTIAELLGDPQTMDKLKALGGLIGQPEEAPEPPQVQNTPSGGDALPAVMKLMPLISSFNEDDDSIRLLRAVKPFLSETRQERLEQAIRLLRIIRIVPLLRDEGLLGRY